MTDEGFMGATGTLPLKRVAAAPVEVLQIAPDGATDGYAATNRLRLVDGAACGDSDASVPGLGLCNIACWALKLMSRLLGLYETPLDIARSVEDAFRCSGHVLYTGGETSIFSTLRSQVLDSDSEPEFEDSGSAPAARDTEPVVGCRRVVGDIFGCARDCCEWL